MSSFKEKNLLIISYYLPPIKTVAVVRIFNFHLEAQKHFKEIFSLTTTNRQFFPKDEYDFNDDKTTEIWTYDLRRFLSKKNNGSPGLSTKTKSSTFAKFMSRLSYSFPFNLFLADGGLTYILGGFFKGKKLIRENKIEVLFSSYKPYADHLICFLLKIWNPKLVWIADFRDLHVDEIRQNILFPSIQKWFNQRILKRADVVTTVSNGLEKKLRPFNPNLYVLRNGIPSNNPSPTKSEYFEKFTISYTGSIYPKLQTAEIFFKAIKKLIAAGKIDEEKIQLTYAGKDDGIWKEWIDRFSLEKINTTHGFLSKKEAQIIQQRSHINLLLSWASENQKGILTAKFYDYLFAQNPILLIINGAQDEEFEMIFKDLQSGGVVYNSNVFQKDVETFILKYYQDWLTTGEITSPIQQKKIAQFRWDFQFDQFIEFLGRSLN